ncbi:MAG: hypothetical protein KDK89_07745 [Alphaproteobacteria bacterium]|nr:hypothetical protein [Alphaproteobacteria bacterium]
MNSSRETGSGPIPVAINVMDVLRGVVRRKVMIGGLTLIALGAGLAIVNYLKPIYSTEAQVLIQNLETPFDRVQAQDNQRADGVDDRVVASQMAVLKSEDLGRRVVAALGLENNPEFNSLLRGMGSVGKIKLTLGFGVDPRLKAPEQRALDHYIDKLSVYQQPNSNVIAIKYSSSDPKTAAQVANTLAEIYITWTRESQSQPTERAREWLSGQIDDLRKKLARSEEAVERFRAQAGLLQGTTSKLGTQEISELNSQITVAKTASSDARARAEAIRALLQSRGSVESSSDVLASPAVQRLKEQRSEAVRRLAELSAIYLPNHPRMIGAQSELQSLDRQIRAEALKVVTSLEDQARVAEAREKSLLASLDLLKSEESSANLDDVKLKALERDAAADRVLLETLLSRYAEASTRQDLSAQPGLARIIQSAGVPAGPSFPKRGPMVVMITLAGFSFAIGLAFLAELMKASSRLGGVSQEAEDERAEPEMVATAAVHPAAATLVVAPLASSPAAPSQPVQAAWQPPPMPPVITALSTLPRIISLTDAATAMQSEPIAKPARDLVTWASTLARDGGIARIGLTSIGGTKGETSIAAIMLARGIAADGRRTVVADLASAGSWLESLCGVPKGPGLAELVAGRADFTKVIGRDAKSTVHLLRYGQDRSEQSLALILERAEAVFGALAQSYEAVIVNLGEAMPHTPVLLHKCQAALILAPDAKAEDAASAVQVLLATGLKAAGLVLIGQPLAADAPDFSVKMA